MDAKPPSLPVLRCKCGVFIVGVGKDRRADCLACVNIKMLYSATHDITSGTWERRFLAMACMDNKTFPTSMLLQEHVLCSAPILWGYGIGSIFHLSHETGERNLICFVTPTVTKAKNDEFEETLRIVTNAL